MIAGCVSEAAIAYWAPWSVLEGWKVVHRWAPNAGWYKGVSCRCGAIPEAPMALYDLQTGQRVKAELGEHTHR